MVLPKVVTVGAAHVSVTLFWPAVVAAKDVGAAVTPTMFAPIGVLH